MSSVELLKEVAKNLTACDIVIRVEFLGSKVRFKIIISSVLESLGLEGANFYRIKDAFEKGYGEEVMLNRLHTLNFLKSNLIVLSLEDAIFDISKRYFKENYREIQVTPKRCLDSCNMQALRNKKDKFDDDLKRVEFLEVVEDP